MAKISNLLKHKVISIFLFIIILCVIGVTVLAALPYFRPVKIQTKEYIYILKGDEVKISKYLGDDENVVIPDSYLGRPITSMGVECFSNNDTLESVVIPDTVSIIGAHTFVNCKNLKSVKAKNIALVDDGAFREDENLQSVELGEHLAL